MIGRCGEAHCGHNCGMCLIADAGSSWVREKRKAEMAIRKQMAKEEELLKQKETMAKIEAKNVIIRCTKCMAELPVMKSHEPGILWFEPHQCNVK